MSKSDILNIAISAVKQCCVIMNNSLFTCYLCFCGIPCRCWLLCFVIFCELWKCVDIYFWFRVMAFEL